MSKNSKALKELVETLSADKEALEIENEKFKKEIQLLKNEIKTLKEFQNQFTNPPTVVQKHKPTGRTSSKENGVDNEKPLNENKTGPQWHKDIDWNQAIAGALVVIIVLFFYFGLEKRSCRLDDATQVCKEQIKGVEKWKSFETDETRMKEMFAKCNDAICRVDANDFKYYCDETKAVEITNVNWYKVSTTKDGQYLTEKEGLILSCENNSPWAGFVFGDGVRKLQFRLFADHIGFGLRSLRENAPSDSNIQKELKKAQQSLESCYEKGVCQHLWGWKISSQNSQ